MTFSFLVRAVCFAGILIGVNAAGYALEPLSEQPRPLARGGTNAGRMVADVRVTDIEGRSSSLKALAAGRKALAVAFMSPTCPLSGKLMPTLAAVEKEFASQGVSFLYVDPTASDTAESLREAKKTHGFQGAVVHDKELTLASALEVSTTTEVFVIDAAGTLIYRGAVDDQYGLGYAHDAARNEWLRDALRAVTAGQRPRFAATTAPGCAIALPERKTAATTVTWHGRVSRIMQANCQECHRKGGIAPFALESMEDAVSHAGMIKKAVNKGIMPPWYAAAEEGVTHSRFSNDRSLPAADRTDLMAWLDGGRPAGNASDAPLPRQWPDAQWAIGKPDAIFELPRTVDIKATGKMGYVNLQVPTGLTEDRWVQSIEVLPTARAQVHHVLIFAMMPDKDGRTRVRDPNNFFAAYVPGSNLLQYPAGYAKKLPKGTVLHFQLHYTPTGVATQDRTRLGVVYAKEAPRYEVQVAAAGNHRIKIPPGAANHEEKGILPVLFNVQILALMPHMHVRGKSFRYELVTPDNKRKTLLDVPRYDFNWQIQYRLADPLAASFGSRVEVTAVYDNSTDNPANPDPTKTVRWGEQTDDEMLLGYVEYVNPAENPSRAVVKTSTPEPMQLTAKTLGILGKRLDKDGDGKISKDEAGSEFAALHRQLDSNADGFVTNDEAVAALKREEERKRGL
ncbi:MAG TPA: redoxin domain-containing protein [Verrucomicrobiales bacterium]|nr:redoxin domain-containing protein [Verrucomicrobiales bacterium]